MLPSVPFQARRVGCLLAAAALFAGLAAPAARSQEIAGQRGEPLLDIVVMRHGVRAPTDRPAVLARSAVQPWPDWPVAAGELTPRGAALLVSQGRRDRAAWNAAGFLEPGRCPGARLEVVADAIDRDRDSAAAWLSGLAPDCAQPLRLAGAAGGGRSPLFHGGAGERPARVEAVWLTPAERGALDALQRVLLDCSGPACLAAARSRGLAVPEADVDGTMRPKALETAGSLAEDIVLQAAAGFPDGQVGWGRAPAEVRRRLVLLRNADFQVRHRSPSMARYQGRELLQGIAATLAAAAGSPVPAGIRSLAAPGTRVLMLAGHDTNLANLAGLLRLDWHRDDEPDDYPPGGALVFHLVRTLAGPVVQMRVELPTLAGLRDGDLMPPDAVSVRPVAIPDCGSAYACPLSDFLQLAAARSHADEAP